ncbi:MAG: hypothetical protein HRT61_10475 [Ekhidna sp.]|nr:hypothetical protein [Ekhidna sp.]
MQITNPPVVYVTSDEKSVEQSQTIPPAPLTESEQGKRAGLNVLKIVGVYLMNKASHLALTALVVTSLPFVGIVQANDVSKAVAEINAENNPVVVVEEEAKVPWWKTPIKSAGKALGGANKIYARVTHPDVRVEALMQELEATNAELREQKLQNIRRQSSSKWAFESATSCVSTLKDYIAGTKPAPILPAKGSN